MTFQGRSCPGRSPSQGEQHDRRDRGPGVRIHPLPRLRARHRSTDRGRRGGVRGARRRERRRRYHRNRDRRRRDRRKRIARAPSRRSVACGSRAIWLPQRAAPRSHDRRTARAATAREAAATQTRAGRGPLRPVRGEPACAGPTDVRGLHQRAGRTPASRSPRLDRISVEPQSDGGPLTASDRATRFSRRPSDALGACRLR